MKKHNALPPDLMPLLLAGGKGTRLRSVVSDLPKVLAPVSGRPFIAYLLDELAALGFSRAMLSIGYMAETVINTLGQQHRGMHLDYVTETTPLGTGGGARLCLEASPANRFLVFNSDSYVQLDLARFINFHLQSGHSASMVIRQVEDAGRYGKVQLEANGQVIQFAEKTPNAGPGWINAGVYLLERPVFEQLTLGQAASLETDLLPRLCGKSLWAFPTEGAFLDIGLPETYQQAADFFSGLGIS